MEKRILAVIIAVIVVIGGGVTGLIFYYAGESETTSLRIGYIAGDIHHLPYAIANHQEIGGGQTIFEKHGLVVDGYSYANGGVIMDTGFKDNNIDIAYLGAAPAVSKHLNLGVSQLNTTIIAQVNEEGSLLVSDSTVNNASDLVGKKIATPGRATIQYMMLLKYLEDNEISIEDVDIVDLASGFMQLYIEKPADNPDHINAFIVWEPIGSAAVSDGSGQILATSNDIWAHHPCCVIAVNRQFAEEHGDMVDSFISAHKEAIDWINEAKQDNTSTNFSLLLEVGKDFTLKNEAVVEMSLSHLNYNYEITDGFKQKLQEYTEKLIEFEIVQATALQENGNDYVNVQDFVERYISTEYLQ